MTVPAMSAVPRSDRGMPTVVIVRVAMIVNADTAGTVNA